MEKQDDLAALESEKTVFKFQLSYLLALTLCKCLNLTVNFTILKLSIVLPTQEALRIQNIMYLKHLIQFLIFDTCSVIVAIL